MATLEVHDGQGRVERVEITREHPVLFGSNPRCDIVLNGPGILPFHGRIRWKSKRYKADASPEAEFLIVNGRKMSSSSFRRGDEIQIGPCRIFMLHGDDDLPDEDDKTRVQPAPVSSSTSRRKEKRKRAELLYDLPVDLPSSETAVADLDDRIHSDRSRSKRGGKGSKKAGGWAGLWKAIKEGDGPPGQERIVSSPLVIGLAIAFVVLIGLGFILQGVIARTIASRQFNRAVESLDDGDYRNAIHRFDEFLAGNKNPKDPRVSKAKVFRALANVRQFTSTTGASWSHALEAEREMLRTVGQEPAYRDSSTELAELVIRTGEALADRARAGADAKALAEAESSVELHSEVAGKAATTLFRKSRLPGKLADARAAVRKAEIRRQALDAMDQALQAGSSAGVYNARDGLVRRYADLAEDRDVLSKMTKANELIRRAVKFDASRRPAETEPLPEPFGPATSLVIRAASANNRPGPAAANGPVVFALAEGFAYGIDGASGAPLWQRPVGLSSPFPPRTVPAGTSALVFDSRHDELVRLDGRTGAIVWRQGIDEPVAHPPLVLGNQVIQPTATGKLVFLDLKSGERQGTVDLGLKVSRERQGSTEGGDGVAALTPVSDEAGQYLYTLADRDCLFIIKRDPIGCAAVEYLGHASGSISCPPARSGRFFVVAENHALKESRWRVLVIDEEGIHLRPVQQLTFPGWIWDTPASAGSTIWALSDRGAITALTFGSYEQKNPFRQVARLDPDARSTGPAFSIARSEHELWVGSGHPSRFDLDLERGSVKAAWALADTGPALAPLQAAGPLMVLTQQYTDGPGVALWGIEPQSGTVRWRTVLGTGWPVQLAESTGGESLTTLASDGSPLALPKAKLTAGGFVEVQIPRPGNFRLPPGRLGRLETEGLSVIVPGPHDDYLLARKGTEGFRRTDLPTPLGAAPILWGREVLVPGADGRVYLMDPLTNESRAEPYVPPFDRAHPTRWRKPVPVDGDAVILADESGRVRRLTRPTNPRPRLVVTAEVNLGKPILTDPASTGAAVVVATADGRIRALSGRDLSPAGAWPMETSLAVPPASVAGRCFLADKSGGILAVSSEGQRLWSAKLRGAPAIGPPVVKDDAAWFLAADGTLQRLALADGALLDRLDLGILPAGGLRTTGTDLAVPVAPGTIRLLDPKALAAAGRPADSPQRHEGPSAAGGPQPRTDGR